jgi:hypothetical protein
MHRVLFVNPGFYIFGIIHQREGEGLHIRTNNNKPHTIKNSIFRKFQIGILVVFVPPNNASTFETEIEKLIM